MCARVIEKVIAIFPLEFWFYMLLCFCVTKLSLGNDFEFSIGFVFILCKVFFLVQYWLCFSGIQSIMIWGSANV